MCKPAPDDPKGFICICKTGYDGDVCERRGILRIA